MTELGKNRCTPMGDVTESLRDVAGDTIDDRQFHYTHNVLVVASDNWKLDEQRQFSFSGFFRNYALEFRRRFRSGRCY